jgi:hypothetical protein
LQLDLVGIPDQGAKAGGIDAGKAKGVNGSAQRCGAAGQQDDTCGHLFKHAAQGDACDGGRIFASDEKAEACLPLSQQGADDTRRPVPRRSAVSGDGFRVDVNEAFHGGRSVSIRETIRQGDKVS